MRIFNPSSGGGGGAVTLTGAVTGNGTGTIATALGSFTSAQLATALTDETGSGAAVFANGAALISPTFAVGTGVVTIKASGILAFGYATNANVGTAETDLTTYSMPANTFTSNLQMLTYEARGQFTGSANAKAYKMYFGSTVIVNNAPPTSTAGSYVFRVSILRIGVNSQIYNYTLTRTTTGGTGQALLNGSGNMNETETSVIIIKSTGTGGATNEINQTFEEIYNHNS